MSDTPVSNHPLKNVVMAAALMLFLALSFKLSANLTPDTRVAVSQTDSVVSTLNQPNNPVALPPNQ